LPKEEPHVSERARELLQYLQSVPAIAGRSIPASDIEMFVYPHMCEEKGWPWKPWHGRNGVAKHFGQLVKARDQPVEDEDGELSKVKVYDIPKPEAELVQLEEVAKRKREGRCPGVA
jgi:hypothetical protein